MSGEEFRRKEVVGRHRERCIENWSGKKILQNRQEHKYNTIEYKKGKNRCMPRGLALLLIYKYDMIWSLLVKSAKKSFQIYFLKKLLSNKKNASVILSKVLFVTFIATIALNFAHNSSCKDKVSHPCEDNVKPNFEHFLEFPNLF